MNIKEKIQYPAGTLDVKEREEAFWNFASEARALANIVGGVDENNLSEDLAIVIAGKIKTLYYLFELSRMGRLPIEEVREKLISTIGEDSVPILKTFYEKFFNDIPNFKLFYRLSGESFNQGRDGLGFIARELAR